jgi:hypothetical protein
MEQSPYWEAYSSSATQEIPWLLCNSKLQYIHVVKVFGFGAVWIRRPMLTFRRNMMSLSSRAEVIGQFWRWRQHVSPKRQHWPVNPHSTRTQDFYNMMIIAVRTSNNIFQYTVQKSLPLVPTVHNYTLFNKNYKLCFHAALLHTPCGKEWYFILFRSAYFDKQHPNRSNLFCLHFWSVIFSLILGCNGIFNVISY